MRVDELAPVVADELGVPVDRVRAGSRLGDDLGMDSLGLLTLLLRLEQLTGGPWSIETFPMVTTVQDLCDAATRQEQQA